MDNEVSVISWTKLDVDIGFPRSSLWCRLVSIGQSCRWRRNTLARKRTVTSTLKTALMSDDFPEPLCYGMWDQDSILTDNCLSAACAHLPYNENSKSMYDLKVMRHEIVS